MSREDSRSRPASRLRTERIGRARGAPHAEQQLPAQIAAAELDQLTSHLAATAADDQTGATTSLLQRMQTSAATRLQTQLDGAVDAAELQRSIDRARALRLPAELIEPAQPAAAAGGAGIGK